MRQKQLGLSPRPKVLLGTQPHRPNAELPVGTKLGGTRPDPAIARQHHQAKASNHRHPIEVEGAEGDLLKVVMPGMKDVGATTPAKELAEP